jgi:hypothetical protein
MDLGYLATTLAQDAAAQGDGVPGWLKVIASIVTTLGTAGGLIVAIRTSRKVALESRNLQLDILQKEGKIEPLVQVQGQDSTAAQQNLARQTILQSPSAIAAQIQGYIVRFIVLYLTLQAWHLVASLVSPIFSIGLSFSFRYSSLPDLLQYGASALVGYIYTIVDIVIFLSLGWPLLKDIARSYGLNPRDLIRTRRWTKTQV